MVGEHLDVSGVVSLMEVSLQNPVTSLVHIGVGQICCVPDDVFIELQGRRVRWYQSWARHPEDHHAVVTAVLGTCKVEEIVGVQRLTSEGNVCLSSTPMARQMADDIRKMSQLSEEVGEWYAQRTSDVAIFTPGC